MTGVRAGRWPARAPHRHRALTQPRRPFPAEIPIRPDACVECLLPDEMIARVLDKEIRMALPELSRVDVRLMRTS